VWEKEGQVFLWDGKRVRLLTPPDYLPYQPRFPRINDAGQVVWFGQDDPPLAQGLSLWDGTRIRKIDGPPEPYVDDLQFSNAGVATFTVGRRLYLWDGETTRPLAQGIYTPGEMNEKGQVVWNEEGTVHLGDGRADRPLGRTSLSSPSPRINDAGEVVWAEEVDTRGAAQIVRWDGTTRQVISPAAG